MKNVRKIGRAFRNEFKKIFKSNFGNQIIKKKKSVINRKRINCSLTEEEYKKISLHAKKTDLKITAYFKKSAFAYFDNQYILPKNSEKILQNFIFQLRSIGNNLNQIAKKTNKLKKVANFFNLKKELQKLHSLENAIQKFISNPSKK
jgi:hypothetical protein